MPFPSKSSAFIIFFFHFLDKNDDQRGNGAFLFDQNGFTWQWGALFTYSRETTSSLFHIFIVVHEAESAKANRVLSSIDM